MGAYEGEKNLLLNQQWSQPEGYYYDGFLCVHYPKAVKGFKWWNNVVEAEFADGKKGMRF